MRFIWVVAYHPDEFGHLFRFKVATLLDRSDTGPLCIMTDSSVSVKFFFLSHRSSLELNSVSIVNQSVQDGIGNGGSPIWSCHFSIGS